MLYITQLVYIHDDAAAIFEEFEAVALPLIPKYGGELLCRLRPGADAYISGTIPKPNEIHLVSFEQEEQLNAFMQDEERKNFLHLKEASIKSVLLIKGSRMGA